MIVNLSLRDGVVRNVSDGKKVARGAVFSLKGKNGHGGVFLRLLNREGRKLHVFCFSLTEQGEKRVYVQYLDRDGLYRFGPKYAHYVSETGAPAPRKDKTGTVARKRDCQVTPPPVKEEKSLFGRLFSVFGS